MKQTIVVIGAGQAGALLAANLRTQGFADRIIVIGEEDAIPYQRPPLSKHLLAGDVPVERSYLKPADFYQKSEIELRLNTRVEAIERAGKTVALAGGEVLRYDKLVLATGSRVRTLTLPGSDLAGIHYLRTLADMHALQAQLRADARLVIVGGGYIGLEVASVAVKKGVRVTVLEMMSRLMQRVVGPEISTFYHRLHGDAGVNILTETQVTGFRGEGRVAQVLCADGSELAADAVLVGIGIVPNTELAATAGLAVDNGIVVDEYARTEDPAIVAVGDCTNHPNKHLQRRLRLESVPNTLGQARTAAATLCGELKAYDEVPWFWSDQYDLKLQIVGFIEGHDQVVLRGDPAQRQFMVCYLKEGELQAFESVNNVREFMLCRQLVAQRAKVTPEQLLDTRVSLKELLA